MLRSLRKLSLSFLFFSSVLVADDSAEHTRLLRESWNLLFNEEFAGARSLAVQAQQLNPADPESYELVSTILIADLKKKLNIFQSDKVQDTAKLGDYTVEVELCQEQIAAGIKVALDYLAPPERENDTRVQFLLAKLYANRLWLILQILGERHGYKDYQNASNMLSRLLKKNPIPARALTLAGWFNYTIANQPFYFRWPMKLAGITGEKQTALTYLRRAVATPAEQQELSEARFSLLTVLLQEKEWKEAHELAMLLGREYPRNQRLKQQAQAACKSPKCPQRPHVR